MVGLMLDLQTFQLKYGVNGHEHVVTLRGYRPGRRLCQRRIRFQRLVKRFDFPPFLVDRRYLSIFAEEATLNQIQRAGAAVLVRKDPPYQKHFLIEAFQPAAHCLPIR
ncbi:hypothetical protein SAMN05421882_11302 [Nitrosomonas communis]|uniref:Uncharacterized protein n=1 Tax=Nitrosomonas communis TaxID=44574 RepID=A0A1H3AC77_9PROT|nr:hypothetical protein SAMN05421882_11302 [Nitrosomonas communis]